MSPSLEEMSLEELWQLFPIFLREHQDEWKEWYEEERLLLLSFCLQISWFGLVILGRHPLRPFGPSQ